MIQIIYCPEELRVLVVNTTLISAQCDNHNPFIEGFKVSDIDEEKYDGSSGWITKNGTVINNYAQWLTYLERYIPS